MRNFFAALRSKLDKAVNGASKFALGLVAAGAAVAATSVPQPAHAAAAAAVTAIEGAGPGIISVQGAMIGALVLIVVFALIKRAMGR